MSLHYITNPDKIWSLAGPILQRAIDKADGKYTLESVYEGIKSENLQLWANSELSMVGVTAIIEYPSSKRCSLMFCAGEKMENWFHMKHHVEKWAKLNGCDAVEMMGRPGWERKMKDYEKIHIVLRKKL